MRPKKVLIDWSQNTAFKTTVSVYSMRARTGPRCPRRWSGTRWRRRWRPATPEPLVFEAPDVLRRVAEKGDLMAPLLSVEQALPALSSA